MPMQREISELDVVESYLEATTPEVFENANKYPGPTGLLSYVAENRLMTLVRKVFPSEIYRLHTGGVIHIHKLPHSLFIPYCSGHSVERLLKNGLKTPTITAYPAKHMDTFSDHVANYLMTMQHYFSGAQAFGAVELYAGPFIRKDSLSYREVKQNVQRMIFNLNFPSRTGMQTPFTNFTVVLDAAKKKLDGDKAIIAGEEVGCLGDYLEEAKMFVKALYEVHGEGDASGRPFTFPIPTIMTTSKILFNDPEVMEAVFTAASKKGSGYWLNTRIVDPDASYAMCCRINISVTELRYAAKIGGLRLESLKKDVEEAREEYIRGLEKTRMGGLWAIPDITGSKAVISINLPRIALDSMRDDEAFRELLDTVLTKVRAGLVWMAERYWRLSRRYREFYSMLHTYVPEVFTLMGTPYFLTVGVIGLPEAAAIMEGDPKAWFEGGRRVRIRMRDWMAKIVSYIVNETRKWSKTLGYPFNVEEVPGESAAARLASIDASMHPEVLDYLPQKDEPIYSTSIAPYYADLSLWERVEIEEKIQPLFTGGVMMHIFLGEQPDPEALAKLTKKLTSNTSLVYWSYTPAVAICPKCGWNGIGLIKECPRCGAETEIWSRIIGYYRPLKNWNPARKREFWTRRHISISSS